MRSVLNVADKKFLYKTIKNEFIYCGCVSESDGYIFFILLGWALGTSVDGAVVGLCDSQGSWSLVNE